MSSKNPKEKTFNYPAVKQDAVDLYFRQIGQIPLLTPEEEKELGFKWFDEDDSDAAQKLVLSNLRFVVKVAREYSKYGVKMSDLIQEGNMGLMHAVEKFDPNKGYRLITYAVWWIRAYIQAFVLRSLSIVRSGTTRAQRRVLNGLQKAQKRIATMQGANLPVTTKQLAAELEVSEKDVKETIALLGKRDVSTAKNLSNHDGQFTVEDTLEDTSQSIETQIIRQDVDEKVQVILQDLYDDFTPRERYMLEHRLLAQDPMTLEAVGKEFGVTRERVRQLEKRLKTKLKKSFEAKGITGTGLPSVH